MTAPAPNAQSLVQALLQEHEELVQLFVHEDSMARQLNLVLLAAGAGLFAAANTLEVFVTQKPVGIALVVVLFAGALISVVGFFVLKRSKIHRISRLFRAYDIEAQLAGHGIPIRTFGSAEGNIFVGRMLAPPAQTAPPQPGDNTRPLNWHERVEVLDLQFAFNLLALVFLALAGWVLVGRPWF